MQNFTNTSRWNGSVCLFLFLFFVLLLLLFLNSNIAVVVVGGGYLNFFNIAFKFSNVRYYGNVIGNATAMQAMGEWG